MRSIICFLLISVLLQASSCFQPFSSGSHHQTRGRCSFFSSATTETARTLEKRLKLSFSGDYEVSLGHDIGHSDFSSDKRKDSKDGVQVQLWLDLRDTSIHPLTALLHLTDDIWDEYEPPEHKSFIVDKVILDNRHKNLRNIFSDMKEEFEDEIGFVTVQKKDEVVSAIIEGDIAREPLMDNACGYIYEFSEMETATRIGRVFAVLEDDGGIVNVDANPMPVLETVLDGKWVILDTKENDINIDSICNLVGLVSNGIAACRAFNLGMAPNDPPSESTTAGGIGVACKTQAQLVEIGSLFQSMRGNKFNTTESGVLIASGEEVRPDNSDATVNYALVMPFDVSLWKIASYIFG